MGLLPITSEREQRIKEFKQKTNLKIDSESLDDLMSSFETENLFNCKNEELFFKVAYILFKRNTNITEDKFVKRMSELNQIKSLFSTEEDYLRTVSVLVEYPSILKTNIFESISYAFSDKKIISEALSYIFNLYRNEDNQVELENISNLERAVSYLTKARKHYVDDRALFTSFINFLSSLGINALKYASKEELDKKLEEHLTEDRRADGIYDISHEELEFLRQVVEELGIKSEQIKTLMSLSDKKYKRN